MSATASQPGSNPARGASVRRAQLLQMGQGQAVQLPVDFHLEGSEVEVRRNTATGELILRGISNAPMVSWKERFAVWDALGSPDEDVLERSTNLPVEREFMR